MVESEPVISPFAAAWECSHENRILRLVHYLAAAAAQWGAEVILRWAFLIGDEVWLETSEHLCYVGGAEPEMGTAGFDAGNPRWVQRRGWAAIVVIPYCAGEESHYWPPIWDVTRPRGSRR